MLHVAADAIGASWLDDPRSAMAGFLVGLLATFLFVRINTRLIRAKVSWWFHDIESEGGTHVHHMVIGVVLMVTVGILLHRPGAGRTSSPRSWRLLFGVGVALTLDEFALILNLQDVYWRKEGRLSVDAVVIVVCAAALFVLGLNPFGDLGDPGLSGDVFRVALAVGGRWSSSRCCSACSRARSGPACFGMFVPIVAIVGAIRLARLELAVGAPPVPEAAEEAGQGTAARGAPGRAHASPGATRSSTSSPASRTCRRCRRLGPSGAAVERGGRKASGRRSRRGDRSRPRRSRPPRSESGAGGRDDREVVEEPALRRHDGLTRRRQVEPGGAVHLRELRRLPRPRRPLHREGVAGDGRGVAVVLHGPREDQLVAVRLDAAERLERARRAPARSPRAPRGARRPAGRPRRPGCAPWPPSRSPAPARAPPARPDPWGCSTPRRPSWPSTGRPGAPAGPRPGGRGGLAGRRPGGRAAVLR